MLDVMKLECVFVLYECHLRLNTEFLKYGAAISDVVLNMALIIMNMSLNQFHKCVNIYVRESLFP